MLKRLLKDKSGATAIEYALIIGMISIVIIGALQSLGTGVGAVWDTVGSGFGTATS